MMLDMLSRRLTFPLGLLLAAATAIPAAQDNAWLDAYREPVSKILAEATKDDFAWQRLAYLTDTFGNRLAGSQALTDAIEWAAAEMARDGIDTVRKDPVKVPHWVRGAESLEVTSPHHLQLPVSGRLSVGTPADGIKRTRSSSQLPSLEQRAAEARGRSCLQPAVQGYGPTVPIASTARRRRLKPARSRARAVRRPGRPPDAAPACSPIARACRRFPAAISGETPTASRAWRRAESTSVSS